MTWLCRANETASTTPAPLYQATIADLEKARREAFTLDVDGDEVYAKDKADVEADLAAASARDGDAPSPSNDTDPANNRSRAPTSQA